MQTGILWRTSVVSASFPTAQVVYDSPNHLPPLDHHEEHPGFLQLSMPLLSFFFFLNHIGALGNLC